MDNKLDNNNSEMWAAIASSLPQTPSPLNILPIPEILKVMQYCANDRVEKYDVAIQLLDIISPLRNDIEFLNWKSMVEYQCKKYLRSYETSEQILNVLKNTNTLFNSGRAAYKANRLDQSKKYLEEALQIDPGNSSIMLDYAVTICTMGNFDSSLDIINSIDKSNLDELHAKIVDFNKGWHIIRKGDFKTGMELLHIGREIGMLGNNSKRFARPEWDGKTYPGKTIHIVGEAGIGDEIINARFSKIIKERGMNCTMSTVHKNVSMLSSIKTLDDVFDTELINNKDWDYWTPAMDLPYILGIQHDEIPSEPYISAKPEFINKWKEKTQTKKKLKVGIRWMGNPLYELELGRSIPVEMFGQLSNDDIQLFSFQKRDGCRDLKVPDSVVDISEELLTWDDTMGALKNMDLVISSCTSVPHVAGALGVPTWVVVPLLPYYTWADMKKESYWYDTVNLYRQKVWGRWVEPFDEVKQDLKKLLEMK
jgi:tetratricopeptide (TPR) repeat protein